MHRSKEQRILERRVTFALGTGLVLLAGCGSASQPVADLGVPDMAAADLAVPTGQVTPVTPGSVPCGSAACAVATNNQVCCIGSLQATCAVSDANAFADGGVCSGAAQTLYCDGPEDCAGHSCCAGGGSNLGGCSNGGCGSSKTFCHSSADCPASEPYCCGLEYGINGGAPPIAVGQCSATAFEAGCRR